MILRESVFFVEKDQRCHAESSIKKDSYWESAVVVLKMLACKWHYPSLCATTFSLHYKRLAYNITYINSSSFLRGFPVSKVS